MPLYKESEPFLKSSYFKKGLIGIESPGESIVNFSLVIAPEESMVTGIVELTNTLHKPKIKVNVEGTIRCVNYGDFTKIINLKGEYMISTSASTISSYLQKFTAYLDVDDNWNGIGGFSFENQTIQNTEVKSLD